MKRKKIIKKLWLLVLFSILVLSALLFYLHKEKDLSIKEIFFPPDTDEYVYEHRPQPNDKENPIDEKEENFDKYLDKEPISFVPDIPENLLNGDSLIDEIENFEELSLEERVEYYVDNKSWSNEELKEVEKIKKLVKVQEKAFNEGDYHTYLKNLHPGFRDQIGLTFSNFIKMGLFKEEFDVIVVDYLDEENATVIYVKTIHVLEDDKVVNSVKEDGIITFYKEEETGDWKVFFYLMIE